jgi:hypothetical protein
MTEHDRIRLLDDYLGNWMFFMIQMNVAREMGFTRSMFSPESEALDSAPAFRSSCALIHTLEQVLDSFGCLDAPL